MRRLIRTFFRGLRIALGPFMLLWEKFTTPKGIVRTQDAQAAMDEATRHLTLYQYRTCPFCIRVRRTINGLALKIEQRDVQKNPQHRQALLEGGGQLKVPCLRIESEDGTVTWLYESAEINRYLESRFA